MKDSTQFFSVYLLSYGRPEVLKKAEQCLCYPRGQPKDWKNVP